MVAEYIEREAAIDEQKRFCGYLDNDMLNRLEIATRRIPAADVLPVVRGRDICGTVNGHCEFKCSVCGVELSSVYGGNNDFGLDGGYFNFCPNCGAKMEES